jgi:two-component system cell cycle sensor histidine kinase/response regulator CckA
MVNNNSFSCSHKPKIILLVDDDALFLSLGRELLEHLGYQALTACHAREALELFQTQQSRVQLVIVDFNLPEIDGYQLFQQLKRIAPQIKVLIASGFIGQKEMEKLLQAGVAGMILKPFRASQLQTEILKVLEE